MSKLQSPNDKIRGWYHSQIQSNPVNTAIESVHIGNFELLRENLGALFPQGQSKLSVLISRCL